jgi:hypothetical protein
VIPSDELGAKPRRNAKWRANLCRNLVSAAGKAESVSTAVLDGAGFHTPERFKELRFLDSVPPERKPVVSFDVKQRRAQPVTTGTGVGFETLFDIKFDTTRPLHRAALKAEILAPGARKGVLPIFNGKTVQLLWRTHEPIRYVIQLPVPGLEFVFRLDAEEGSWQFRKQFGKAGR